METYSRKYRDFSMELEFNSTTTSVNARVRDPYGTTCYMFTARSTLMAQDLFTNYVDRFVKDFVPYDTTILDWLDKK